MNRDEQIKSIDYLHHADVLLFSVDDKLENQEPGACYANTSFSITTLPL